MKTDKTLSTSDSLKDHLLSVSPDLFTLYGGKTKRNQITITVSWDSVSLSEAVNTRLDASERQTALESALNASERATLASLLARVKQAETALSKALGEKRVKDSRVSVKGLKVSKA